MKHLFDKHEIQLNKACLVIAVLHWILSFFTDRFIFQYVTWDFSNLTQTAKTAVTYGGKAVFLLVLIGIWQGVFYFVKKADRRYVCCTLVYFALNMCLLLCTWPGIWRMDEFGILNSALVLFPVFWQSYLTSIFYVFSLMLFPFPSGVIIVQCACISLTAGYIVISFVKRFGKWGYLSFVPLCFLPVLDSNLYPMRMSLYAFLELLLLLLIYQSFLNDFEKKTAFCVLAAIVTLWRTESLYYVLAFPFLLWFLFRKKRNRKYLIRTICVYLAITVALFIPQKLGDQFINGNQYDLTSVVLPLVPLTERAYEDNGAELEAIDKVVNVETVIRGAKEGKNGINLFWEYSDFQRDGYSNEEYAQFKKAYYSLILKYPKVFLKERWKCFTESVDILQNTTELFTANGVPNYDIFRTYPMTKPVSDSLRKSVISFLEWRSQSDYMQKKAGYGFVYGPFWPMIILLLCWLWCLCNGKWAEFFVISLPLLKAPLIFLTAPSRLFMYYYSLYLIGWVLLFYVLLKLCSSVWERIGMPVGKTLRYARRNGVKKTFFSVMERMDGVHMDALSRKASAYVGCREWSCHKDEGFVPNDAKSVDTRIKVSIVVPAYETNPGYMTELLACVINQTYSNWELIIADASKSDTVEKLAAQKDDRIRYIRLPENKGISENTNAGIEAASGDYIALLDHDDLLTYDALEKMVSRLYEKDVKNPDSVLAVYSDEDKCDGEGNRFYEPNFKPDFNLDLLLSNNYICHFLMVKADVIKDLKLRSRYDGAQDYDLVLRLAYRTASARRMVNSEAAEEAFILHTPYVLYHWRCHEESTAVNTDSKKYAYDAGREALKDFYKSIGMEDSVEISNSEHLGFYRTVYKPNLFAVRKDVAALCGRVTEKGIVTASPDDMFNGLKAYSSGYLHRAELRMEVKQYDDRAVCIRPDLEMPLSDALRLGMKLLYDPEVMI